MRFSPTDIRFMSMKSDSSDDVAEDVAKWTADAARSQLERRTDDELDVAEVNELVSVIRDDVADMVTAALADDRSGGVEA